jgi:hypothetical protein
MGWVVSVTPRPRFTPGERIPGTHWIGGWMSTRAGPDAEARRKILCSCRGSNPGRPVRGQTLYWLSYPGFKNNKAEFEILQIIITCVLSFGLVILSALLSSFLSHCHCFFLFHSPRLTHSQQDLHYYIQRIILNFSVLSYSKLADLLYTVLLLFMHFSFKPPFVV